MSSKLASLFGLSKKSHHHFHLSHIQKQVREQPERLKSCEVDSAKSNPTKLHDELRETERLKQEIDAQSMRAYHYYSKGQFAEAERLYRQLLNIKISPNNQQYHLQMLAQSLSSQEKYQEAESIAWKALHASEKIWQDARGKLSEPQHRDELLRHRVLLVQLLFSQKRKVEATALAKTFFAKHKIESRQLKLENEAWSLNSLARILCEQDAYSEADDILQYLKRISERYLRQPEIANCQILLGKVLNSQERWTEAEELFCQALANGSMNNQEFEIIRKSELTESLFHQKRYGEAESQCRALVEYCESVKAPHKNVMEAKVFLERILSRGSTNPQFSAREPDQVSTLKDASNVTQILDAQLSAFFSECELRSRFTDAQILRISSLLKYIHPEWSKVPRTYIILRHMECLSLIDDLIRFGFSDFHFPATESNLPPYLTPEQRKNFLETQALVLTPSLDLEKGEYGGHYFLHDGEPDPFQRINILGTGSFGEVDKVLSLNTFKEYARKCVPRDMIFTNKRKAERVNQLVAEIQILKRLKHRHVVTLIGSYTDPLYMALIMTPIADMDFSTYLAEARSIHYPELRTFFGCLSHGLKFLHEQNIRHKDIKPRNILVHQGGNLFTDFGLSFDFSDASRSTTVSMVNGMTPRYCAPEVAEYGPRNTSSDVWSLGIVFLEMVVVLKGRSIESMREYFRENGTQQEYVRQNHSILKDFLEDLGSSGRAADNAPFDWITRMLEPIKESRPTAASLVPSIANSRQTEGSLSFCGMCCTISDGHH